MIFARLHKIWNLNKREEGNVESLTAGPTPQCRLPRAGKASNGDFSPMVRFLAKPRALECSPCQGASNGPTYPAAEPPKWTHRRSWRLAEVSDGTPDLSGR